MNIKSVFGKTPNHLKRFVTLISLVLLLSLGFVVPVFMQGLENNNVFTGCLDQKSGKLSNIAIGLEPAKVCGRDEYQITWDYAKPEFDSRITELEERVTELEEPYGSFDLFVDCDAGDTIGATLDNAQSHLGPVNIIISGVCEESIRLERDDVSFSGIQASDGILGLSGSESTVELRFAHRVQFSNMTISGGNDGISAYGSSFTASNITVLNSSGNGISVQGGSVGSIRDCSVFGHPSNGVSAGTGSVIKVSNCEITDARTGVFADSGSNLSLWNTLLANNTFSGVGSSGGDLEISDTIITGNMHGGVMVGIGSSAEISEGVIVENNDGVGITAFEGSSVNVQGAIVRNNGGLGLSIWDHSTLTVQETQIIGNNLDGINVKNLSTVHVRSGTQIIGNNRDGIQVEDLSTARVRLGVEIIDNSGWGINCGGPSTIAVLGGQGVFEPDEIVFDGNIYGDTNCQPEPVE